MTRLIMRLRNALMKLLEWAVIGMMAALVLDVLWGVVSRTSGAFVAWLAQRGIEAWPLFPRGQSKWTEELAIYLLIWVSLLGAALAYAARAHLGVDYLVSKLDPAAARLMDILTNLTVAFFVFAAFLYGGTVLVLETLDSGQMSPALGIKVGYMYLAVPISGAFMLLFALEFILEILSGKKVALQSATQDNAA